MRITSDTGTYTIGTVTMSWDLRRSGAGAPPPSGTSSGTVLVNGSPFTSGPIPYGSRVDVTNGRLTLTTDVGTLTVYGGGVTAVFVLTRASERGKPLIQLTLVGGDFSVCQRRLASVAKGRPPPKKTVRRLWANGKGSFRTRGRYASATIRGTIWLTGDRCDGTLVFVQQGKIDVFDYPKKRHVLVTSGKSYLAQPRHP